MISTGNQDSQMFSTGKDNKYIEFKYAPSDFEIGVYHNKETKTDTYYHLLNLNKIVGFIKKEFEPYDRFVNPESGDYGRVNHTVIELDFKVYNKELKVSKYLINDEGLVTTLEEYDKKLNNSNDNEEIKKIIIDMINIYKDKEDIKMAKIS